MRRGLDTDVPLNTAPHQRDARRCGQGLEGVDRARACRARSGRRFGRIGRTPIDLRTVGAMHGGPQKVWDFASQRGVKRNVGPVPRNRTGRARTAIGKNAKNSNGFQGCGVGALGEIRTSLLKHSGIRRFSLQFGPRDKSRGRRSGAFKFKVLRRDSRATG